MRKAEIELVTRLMADLPHSSDAIALTAIVHNSHGNTDEAERFWKRSLELRPERFDAYNSLGMIAMLKGEHEQAVLLWRRALELVPTKPEVRDWLARALMYLGKPKDAVAVLEDGLKINSATSQSYYLLGQGYLQLNEFEKAKRNYETAVEIQPDYKEPYYGLASVCSRLGREDEAARHRESFRKLAAEQMAAWNDPDTVPDDLLVAGQGFARTLTNAGQIYFSRQHVTSAVECWQKAAAVDPENTACRKLLAWFCQRTGRREEALLWLEQAMRLDPDNPEYKKAHEQLRGTN